MTYSRVGWAWETFPRAAGAVNVTVKKKTQSDVVRSLIKGAHDREAMIRRFGFIPMSVLKHCRGNKLGSRITVYQHAGKHFDLHDPQTSKGKYAANKARISKKIKQSLAVSTPATRAFSVMPAQLVDFFIRFYAAPGQVYLDPFLGQGVQMQVAALRGMAYWGYDLNADFVRFCRAVRDRMDVGKTNGSPSIHLHEGDSRNPETVPDGIGDFCFTSPPYWNVEEYGLQPGQLSAGTYKECVDGLGEIAEAWLPKFKPSAFCVVNVGDINRNNQFYPFHADVLAAWVAAGWKYHDMWILADMLPFATVMAVGFNKTRRAPRCHEYAMVFRPQ